jgi:hypothetical protein
MMSIANITRSVNGAAKLGPWENFPVDDGPLLVIFWKRH